jgi:membrane-bound serine protease (ClpP class)
MRSLTERRGEEAVALGEAMIEDARAVSANEALAVGFIDALAPNPDDLLNQLDGLTVVVDGQEMHLQTADLSQTLLPLSFVEELLLVLTNSILLAILLGIGVQAIIIELSAPGGYIAGVIGLVCIALALYGLGQISVNWLGMGLVLLAFVFFIAEAFTPTFGALSISGALSLLAGLLVLFNSPNTPEYARISVAGAVTISVLTAAFFLFIVYKGLRIQRTIPVSGKEGLIGRSGSVRVPLTSSRDKPPYTGQALVFGQLWRVVADEPLATGELVVVTAVQGLTLQVKKRDERVVLGN